MGVNKSRPAERHDVLYRIIVFRLSVIFIVICAALFLLLFQSSSLFDPNRYLLRKILSLGHIPLFGLIAWIVLLAINLKNPKISNWPIWSYPAAFLFTMGISFLSELVQIIIPRDASIKDFFYNNLGSALFLGGGLLWTNQKFSVRSGRWHKRLRFTFVVASVIIFALVVHPLVLLAIDEIQIRGSFPVIGSFETEREVKRWNGGENEMSLSQEYVDDGKYSLRVTLSPGKYSGICMPHPPSDWRGFSSFDFTVFNPSEKNQMIVLKIFDWDHTYEYNDRFNRVLHISPGKNCISIPLQEIELSPVKRKMRMDKIGQVSFFMKNLKQRQVFFFDNIRLSKRK